MRAVTLEQITPGMKLGKTLFAGDGRVLLHRGTVLGEKYVEHLAGLGFSALYVEDAQLADIQMNDVVTESTRLQATSAVKDAFVQMRTNKGRNFHQDWSGRRALYHAATSIMTEIQASKDLMFQVMELRAQDGYTFAHSVNVCILGMAMARQLNIPHQKLVDLAIGLLLHDIGALLLPEEMRDPNRLMSEVEQVVYRSHAQGGYDLLKDMRETFGATSKIVTLQHHEFWDGTGYPKGLAGDEIHEFAQICGIVDTYDRLITSNKFGRRALPHEALEYIMGTGGRQFRLEMVQAFIAVVAPYPLGTTVRLNTGEAGVVIRLEKGLPHRPVLRLVHGSRLDPNEFRLTEHPDRVVVGVADTVAV
ncbi:MAG: metal dependent phosphohydrolase [Cyanobacteria bacterium RYN_339]|nr:metal dependent phosphohydrolase [Cyanobacteria bacterium RYN_339]